MSAQLNGPVLEITAVPGVNFGIVDVTVEDSSTPPKTSTSTVFVQRVFFTPSFAATMDSLLAGSAPGISMSASFDIPFLRVEKTEFLLQNIGVETGRLLPGSMIGFARAFRSSTIYGFTHLKVSEVAAGRAKFDVVSFEDGATKVVATGELIESPPAVVIDVPNLPPGSLLPTSFTQEFVFADSIFRLPPAAGQDFSITANFVSVSTREDRYLPRTSSTTRTFTTTGLAAGNPRIERIVPPQGEAGLNIVLRCRDIVDAAGGNLVTFAGAGSTRVPAQVVMQSVQSGAGKIVVTVPRAAVRGPVRVTTAGKESNDFRFSPLFRPAVRLFFDTFVANTPTAPRFSHEQPKDEAETAGEVPLQSITFSLDSGQINIPALGLDQQVGTAKLTNRYTGQTSDYTILYDGQEAPPSSRHKFRVTLGFFLTVARLYYSQNAGGNGVSLFLEAGFGGFNAGSLWEYQFTTPIYRPPAAAGTSVTGQMEVISQQWQSFSGTEMRLTKMFNRNTE